MKRICNFSYSIVIVICAVFFWGAGISMSEAGPPGPPMPPGPAGPKKSGPMRPQIPIVVLDDIQDKDCVMRKTNTVKSCVNDCPVPELESVDPDLEGAECILKCIENFANTINRCM